MKHITAYSVFESESEFEPIRKVFTREQLNWLDRNTTSGQWKYNPQTGKVDVHGDFDCSGQGLTDFKGVEFGLIDGHFYCRENKLTTLEGAPTRVNGTFDCSSNQLESLDGAPSYVGWSFACSNNNLTSLEGLPTEMEGDCSFLMRENPIPEEMALMIARKMRREHKSYHEAVRLMWDRLSTEDQATLYKPEFEWVSPEERRKMEAMKTYGNIKNMI